MPSHEPAAPPGDAPAPKPKTSSKSAVAGLVAGLVGGGVGVGGFMAAAPGNTGLLLTMYGGFVVGGLLFGVLYDPLLKPIFKGKNEMARALTILLLGWALFIGAPVAIGMTPPEGIPLATDVLKLLVGARFAGLGITFAVFLVAGVLFGLLYEKGRAKAPAPPPA